MGLNIAFRTNSVAFCLLQPVLAAMGLSPGLGMVTLFLTRLLE